MLFKELNLDASNPLPPQCILSLGPQGVTERPVSIEKHSGKKGWREAQKGEEMRRQAEKSGGRQKKEYVSLCVRGEE